MPIAYLHKCFAEAHEFLTDPYDICLRTEQILAEHGIRVGITETVISIRNQPYGRGHIVDISFSETFGFYAVFIGTTFSGSQGNCFIPETTLCLLETLN